MGKRYGMALKTACFLLALVCLFGALLGIGAACLMASAGFYRQSLDTVLREKYAQCIENWANNMAYYHARESNTVQLDDDFVWYNVENRYGEDYEKYYGQSNYRYEIYSTAGKKLAGTYNGEAYLVSGESTEPVYYTKYTKLPDQNGGIYADYEEVKAADYVVKGYILEDMTEDDEILHITQLWQTGYRYRYTAITGGVLCAFGAIVCVIYLLCTAGHRPGREEITLNLLDKLPGDLYLGGVVLACFGLWALASWAIEYYYRYQREMWVANLMVPLCFFAAGTLILGLLLSVTARLKYGKGYWWRHSVIGWLLLQALRFCKWLLSGLRSFLRMLPTVALWLLIGVGLWTMLVLLSTDYMYHAGLFLLVSMVGAVLVCYVAYCVGKLKKSIQKLARGDLNTKISTRNLRGTFRVMAVGLNELSNGASLAVERQMKSERMKTELITNVSHDIKTPLTSIVNYVDLLRKPHTPEEEKQYLEVLDRQSKRMKKLTEDLVEMSKASSGSLPVNLMPTNVVELVNQALAEYQEKLESHGLETIFTACREEVLVMADGRLFWRILDNLLGNVVKYAQEGTRVYVDVMQYQSNVLISVKNISRDRLNISSEELMERFVRGDSSRNTEGSGLGLNIAKSLAELQKAQLNLVIDGDLFKTVVLFGLLSPAPWQEPRPEEPNEAASQWQGQPRPAQGV